MNKQIETLAYLSPEGSFSYEVATGVRLSGSEYKNTTLIPCSNIALVCQAVFERKAQQGIVPIENSTEGAVNDALIAFKNIPFRIIREINHPISQSIYWQKGVPREEIEIVASKDTALGQVRKNANKNFPNAKFEDRDSTVAAILEAAGNPKLAGVGPSMAGAINQLTDILQQLNNQQDNALNTTRFAVVGIQNGETNPHEGESKSTLIAQIPNRPGGLFSALEVLTDEGINLSRIKSLGEVGGFETIWMDLLGHQEDRPLIKALSGLYKQGVGIRSAGSYPIAQYLPPSIPWELNMEEIVEKLRGGVINGTKYQDKTTVVFTLRDTVGSLKNAIKPFHTRGIDLIAIDSLATGMLGEYAFYLSFATNNHLKQGEAIDELKSHSSRLVLL